MEDNQNISESWCGPWTTGLCLKYTLIIFIKILNKLLWDKDYQQPRQ